ncbi:AAA family ATPase [Bordetella sp. 15P40C-2]|uniref:AAA family ATPase n=1 Tax=Bordetella sp. 15P40C-2 TaxID=2572246 RepID=UPI0013247E3C|nr:AAA family ATPase [Bordetella sp. 15P40C-2]MVW73520.1 AAA family ATPase [Bordetella sp. 15P40C-2]
MMWQDIQSLVPPPGKPADFNDCLAAFPQLEFAKLAEQNPLYHGEGNTWIHTMLVVEALLADPAYQQASREDREIVFLAALLHDVAKYSTTIVEPTTGQPSQPGHSRKGAIDTRIALWEAGAPFAIREAVCNLILAHQVPFFAMMGSRRKKSPQFIVHELSWQVSVPLLGMLAQADMRGRVYAGQQQVLDNIELFREVAREEGCYGLPRSFADAHTRVSYFRGADVHPDYPLFQRPGSKVTVMSGLPATGKDTWVAQHRGGLPVVSFDEARRELGLKHGENDGKAAHYARDQAKALLRAHRPFVWNATHLSPQMRDRTLDLLFAYDAEVELIYLEQPPAELFRRNSRRDSSLTNKTLRALTLKWEPPLLTEAHQVHYLT